MSLLGLVSTEILEPVVDKLFACGMEELVDDTITPLCGKHKVLVNGDWVGLVSDPEFFVEELKGRRRQSELPRQVCSVSAIACVLSIFLRCLVFTLDFFLLHYNMYQIVLCRWKSSEIKMTMR